MKEDHLNVDIISVLVQKVFQEDGYWFKGDVAADDNVPKEMIKKEQALFSWRHLFPLTDV